MTETVIILPHPISVNNLYRNVTAAERRKNPGLPGRVKTRKYTAWCNEAGWEINRQKAKRFDGPVSISYAFGNEDLRYDIDNLFKGINDLLKEMRVIVDDSAYYVKEIHAVLDPSIDGVKVEIRTFLGEE